MRYVLLTIDKASILADDEWSGNVGIEGAYPTKKAAIEAFRDIWGEGEDEGHYVGLVDLQNPDKEAEGLLDN